MVQILKNHLFLIFVKKMVKKLYLFYNVLTTIQLNFKKREIKILKSYISSVIRTRNPNGWRLRKTCAIGCAKKMAGNKIRKTKMLG